MTDNIETYNAQGIYKKNNLSLASLTIPYDWFQAKSLRKSGKIYHLAIMVLADIIYKYYTDVVLNESTDKILSPKKVFNGKMQQRNYQDFATLLSCSKRQAVEAIKFLTDAKIINKELRSVKTKIGMIQNVLFLSPNALAVAELQTNFVLEQKKTKIQYNYGELNHANHSSI